MSTPELKITPKILKSPGMDTTEKGSPVEPTSHFEGASDFAERDMAVEAERKTERKNELNSFIVEAEVETEVSKNEMNTRVIVKESGDKKQSSLTSDKEMLLHSMIPCEPELTKAKSLSLEELDVERILPDLKGKPVDVEVLKLIDDDRRFEEGLDEMDSVSSIHLCHEESATPSTEIQPQAGAPATRGSRSEGWSVPNEKQIPTLIDRCVSEEFKKAAEKSSVESKVSAESYTIAVHSEESLEHIANTMVKEDYPIETAVDKTAEKKAGSQSETRKRSNVIVRFFRRLFQRLRQFFRRKNKRN